MRYFIELSYLGAGYHGWQSQPNAVSVQSAVEDALSLVLREHVAITGAGRTDTGVNARVMYAHFDAGEIPPENFPRLIAGLNKLSGNNIAIHRILPTADSAHARFDALSRTYKYFISFRKSAFTSMLAWRAPFPLDIDRMNEAAAELLHTDDFTSFAKLHSDSKTNICKVTHAGFEPWNSGFLAPGDEGAVFTITADRFLRNMVRAVVGTLVDVGRGKIDIEGFRRIISEKNRCKAGTSMPPQALYLWDIAYPQEIFI